MPELVDLITAWLTGIALGTAVTAAKYRNDKRRHRPVPPPRKSQP